MGLKYADVLTVAETIEQLRRVPSAAGAKS
jgi:hypothetical protein